MKPVIFTAWLEGFLEGTTSAKNDLNNEDLDKIKHKLNKVEIKLDRDSVASTLCVSLQSIFEIENPSSFSQVQVEKIKEKLISANSETAPVPVPYKPAYIAPYSPYNNKYRC